MKKTLFLFSLLAALLIPSSAFALSCKVTQGPGSPDACFTEVTVSSAETTLVSVGTLLVYDSDGATPAQGGYQVRVSRASGDNVIAAGFAQKRIATGETAQIQTYGWGQVRPVGGIATGDRLYAAASGDVAAFNNAAASGASYASIDPLATALEASATNGTTARYAYIKI